ncbi:MAG: ribonuclease HII [Calditrichaeota bacterium]|nr:MAG: ribonuclease HII [Calditrichota bacterium]
MNRRFDRRFWDEGIRYLCGVDEAGRGPLAGPVVAAAVIMPQEPRINGVEDSKKLNAVQREKLEKKIRERAISWAVGVASVQEIEQINILQATFRAMRRAVAQLQPAPRYVLVDGRDFPRFERESRVLPGEAVIGGDGRSYSIACASILAKVHRDALMIRLAEEYPVYGFERHKGYASREHIAAIKAHGPAPCHRRKFIRRFVEQSHDGQQSLF